MLVVLRFPRTGTGRFFVALTDRDLEHLERLARVKLSAGSREKLRGQLERIIEFVRQLEGVDTTGVEARSHVGEIKPELRADATKPCLPREEVLGAAPQREREFFGVPPVIEADEL
jgi:aspartyl-tRNA(Asn)/glutamyl-tRNA(Gln) amidotransferase subunit C